MSELNDKESISDLPSKTASYLCSLIDCEDDQLKEAFRGAIQNAMSVAIASSKKDLLRAAFDSRIATPLLLQLVDEAIPTFGADGAEHSSKMFGSQ